MVTVSYPSQDFPAPLPIALEIPEGWVSIHVPYMLISARSNLDYEGFKPNVTVGWQRVKIDVDADHYVQESASVGAASYENYQLLDSKTGSKGNVAVAATRQRFTAGNGVPTLQETLFVFGPVTTERSRDLFQVTATRHEADEESRTQLTAILDSFTVLDLTAVSEKPSEATSS